MKTFLKNSLIKNFTSVMLATIACYTASVSAQTTINTLQHYDLRPELLDETDPPNIMVIFDNSGSMGSSGNGNPSNGTQDPDSRSFIARTAMQQVFNGLQDTVNLGLTVYGWDASTRSCGRAATHWGSLRANIVPFDGAANANIQNLLATETFANRQNIPNLIRSSGCTPISGSLQTVMDYVNPLTNLIASRNPNGVTPIAPPTLQCSVNNAVILVTDGVANSDNTTIGCTNTGGTQCSRQKVGELETLGWEPYVVGFGNATGLANNLNAIASGASDDNGNPRTFFPAANGPQLIAVFNQILGDIFQRVSSGSSAAVSTSSNQDAGFFVQSSYVPLVEGVPHNGSGTAVAAGAANAITEQTHWSGLSRLLFVDPFGFIREDTSNKNTFDLLDYSADRAIRIEVNSQGKTVFRRLDVTIQPDGTPLETGAGPQLPLVEVGSLWELSESLDTLYKVRANSPSLSITNNEMDMRNNDIKLQRVRSNFKTDNGRRMILTNIDGDERDFTYNDGSSSSADFGDNPIQASEIGYLGFAQGQTAAAKNLIDWVRGADDLEGSEGFRNRTVFTDTSSGSRDYVRMLLGDTIHSTPVVVGAPSEPFFELYGDTSYKSFRDANSNRRTVAYIGSNDGMIHAVNSGEYDPNSRTFSENGVPLGFEMWAFIPESILPHLRFFASSNYTASNHVYGVDGPIIVKDVKIGGTWKTLLFAGTGYGGFDHQVDSNTSDANTTLDKLLKPSIVILDVTDPEEPPIFYDELVIDNSNTDFGATTVKPSVYHRNGRSYLVIGAGPAAGYSDDERSNPSNATANSNVARDEMKGHYSDDPDGGNIFIYELRSNGAALQGSPRSIGNGFIGDITSVDWDYQLNGGNPDYDQLYFGINSGSGENDDFSGELYRYSLPNGPAVRMTSGGSFDHEPFTSRNGVFGQDDFEAWVFAGTGRINAQGDFSSTNDNNAMYGLLEGFDSNGDIISSSSRFSNIVDVTGVQVRNSGDLVNPPSGVSPQTFLGLSDEIQQNRKGWYKSLSPGASGSPAERVPGRASTPGAGVLTYISFTPQSSDACSVGGSSDLNTVAFGTGTAIWNEANRILNEGDPAALNSIIGDSTTIANTLVTEFIFSKTNQEEIKELLKPGAGGPGIPGGSGGLGNIGDPVHPTQVVQDPECITGTQAAGLCVGADSTNPSCSANLPGECGFGRKSFHEVEYRYYR